MPNKMYSYNDEHVYKILNKDVKRKTVIYAGFSISKQKSDLQNQLQQWCFMDDDIISAIYSGIEPGILFKKGNGFFGMLD